MAPYSRLGWEGVDGDVAFQFNSVSRFKMMLLHPKRLQRERPGFWVYLSSLIFPSSSFLSSAASRSQRRKVCMHPVLPAPIPFNIRLLARCIFKSSTEADSISFYNRSTSQSQLFLHEMSIPYHNMNFNKLLVVFGLLHIQVQACICLKVAQDLGGLVRRNIWYNNQEV